ncbi:MAG: HAD family hydrolase [Candidatus Aenigmatarchaeota archaeon]
MLKTVLFDFDGTIFELVLDWKGLIRWTCRTCFGCRYSRLGVYDFLVMYHNVLRHKLPRELADRAHAEREKQELGGVERGHPMQGAREVVLGLGDKYKVGLVSANYRRTLKEGVKKMGLEGAFKVVVSVEDVRYSKPDKLPILAACKKLGCSPQEAVYVGDHPGDIEAARSAGAKSIILLGRRQRRDFPQEPDFFIASLGELPDVLKKLD